MIGSSSVCLYNVMLLWFLIMYVFRTCQVIIGLGSACLYLCHCNMSSYHWSQSWWYLKYFHLLLVGILYVFTTCSVVIGLNSICLYMSRYHWPEFYMSLYVQLSLAWVLYVFICPVIIGLSYACLYNMFSYHWPELCMSLNMSSYYLPGSCIIHLISLIDYYKVN